MILKTKGDGPFIVKKSMVDDINNEFDELGELFKQTKNSLKVMEEVNIHLLKSLNTTKEKNDEHLKKIMELEYQLGQSKISRCINL